jgi:hypothetical protein
VRLLLALTLLAACSSGAVHPTTNTPIDPTAYRLATTQPWYFASEWDVGAKFLELRTDGTYRTIDREHMGVGEDDAGRWRQTASGELLLCSSHVFANIDSGRLWIVVANAKQYGELPALAGTLRQLLATGRPSFRYKEDVEWPLSAGVEDYQHPSINDEDFGKDIERADLEALVRAIDAYRANGDQNLMRTTARSEGAAIYLDGSWELPHRAGEARERVRAVDQASFHAATHQTQPFIIHTEMNDCLHRELETIPDWKKDRLVAGCRSF